ncbi:Dihydrolipoyl dehydrogenase [Sulfuracidifex tepidarius]|uniref:Dihydrolipoyl dehydrogenase n=1 Tax=Sulfuracidifex tepidarius TaxID=1294262 RepID=A0A510DTJ8_9CREN|nr:NAD(P)/FAD-dependent oxidoreductase [Sulfuracidifex tepidarius]BBG23499.1 Dihydrolipoyl dehydrogenase [Sulfuracidifex tepidarius]
MYEVLVIGGGSAGYVAGSVLARKGIKTAVVEKEKFGGTCVNSGCVPSIFLFDSSFMLSRWKEIGDYKGINVDVEMSDCTFSKRDDIVSYLSSAGRSLVENAGAQVYLGEAKIREKGKAEVNGETIEFKRLIVASGSSPISYPGVITEDEAVNLRYVPRDMIVVGGGYAGVEIAQIFARLGSSVTLVTRHRILSGFSEKARDYVIQSLEFDGVQVKEFHEVIKMEGNEVVTNKGTMKGEVVVSAMGRRPVLPEGLTKNYNVKVNEKGIAVRRNMMTDDCDVFAVGDVIDKPNKTAHSAMYEAIVASQTISGTPMEVSYECIPKVIYSDPQVGIVGVPEKATKIAEFPFNAVTRATISGLRDGMVRIGFNERNEIVYGEVIGKNAEELINILTLAVKYRVNMFDLATTVFVHPSLSEAISNASKSVFDLDVDRFK